MHTQITITLSLRKNAAPKIIDDENILGKDILFMSISTDGNSYAPIGLPIFYAKKILGSDCLELRKHLEMKIIVAENFLGANTLNRNDKQAVFLMCREYSQRQYFISTCLRECLQQGNFGVGTLTFFCFFFYNCR